MSLDVTIDHVAIARRLAGTYALSFGLEPAQLAINDDAVASGSSDAGDYVETWITLPREQAGDDGTLIAEVRHQHGSEGQLEFEDDAVVLHGDTTVTVQAWVWVDDNDAEREPRPSASLPTQSPYRRLLEACATPIERALIRAVIDRALANQNTGL